MKRTYNKLVRDKIPEIIEKSGEKAIIKILEDNEYRSSLFEKAKEELWEVETAESIDETKAELADLLEVVRALSEYNGGGFSERIFLIGVN